MNSSFTSQPPNWVDQFLQPHRIDPVRWFITSFVLVLLLLTLNVQARTTLRESQQSIPDSQTGCTGSTHPDYTALEALYQATDGPQWTNSSGWLSNCDPCKGNDGKPWYGITCTNSRVTFIQLTKNQLKGTLPTSLSALTQLEGLGLGYNQLSGPISTGITALTQLIGLNLKNNQLSGPIPGSIGALKNLVSLAVSNNQLNGPIPDELIGLTELEVILANNNQLSGSIPSSIGSLIQLKLINLSYNQLSGSIPSTIESLIDLAFLELNDNQLSGPIPENIGSLPRLIGLSLNRNKLIGCVPASLLAFCGDGRSINLSENPGLPGGGDFKAFCKNGSDLSHPDRAMLADLYSATDGNRWDRKDGWLSTCSPCAGTDGKPWYGIGCIDGRVTSIELANNKLKGSLPTSLSALTQLQVLDLNHNQLSGSIPTGITSLAHLQVLDLSGNDELKGSIPSSIGLLTQLQWLDLSDNQLSGSIPENIGSLIQLTMLNLSYNQLNSGLKGSIPGSIGSLTQLQWLDLSKNQLSGTITPFINTLKQLKALDLSSNQLSGPIPDSISSLTQLTMLDLGRNQLSGPIPDIYSLTRLGSLSLNDNQLVGPISSKITLMTNLVRLDLNDNQLSGSIPDSIGSLIQLKWLNLGNNQLSGCLPVSLKTFCRGDRIYINLSGNTALPGGGDFGAFCSGTLEGCPPNKPLSAVEPPFSVKVLGNPVVGEGVEIEVQGASDQPLHWQSLDSRGRVLGEGSVERALTMERQSVAVPSMSGIYFLQVSTPQQQKIVKVIRR